MSDAFTINNQAQGGPLVDGAWRFPGPANMEHAWGQNSTVTVGVTAGELGFVVYEDSLAGHNADVFLCLYDLANIENGIAQPVLVNGQPVRLTFLTSTGAAMGPGLVMNGVHRDGQYSRAGRALPTPLSLGGVTTPATGGPFQIGALLRFFGPGGKTLAYEYFLEGTVDAAADPAPPPPPPPSPSGEDTMLVFVEAGALAAGQTKFTGQWAGSLSESDVYTQIILSRAGGGVLKGLRVKTSAAPGAGQAYTFTVRKNGTDTALTVTIAESAISGADVAHTVAVVDGDVLTLKQVASDGTPNTNVTASVELAAA